MVIEISEDSLKPDKHFDCLTEYVPQLEDLWFRQKMLCDPQTMSYNHAWGTTIDFPREDWQNWYDWWIANPENRRFYRYLKNSEGNFVGEIAYHYDSERDIYIADVIVFAPYRRKGYGGKGLKLLCEAAGKNGISVIYDDIAIDNPAIGLFLKNGFEEQYRTDEIIMLAKKLL